MCNERWIQRRRDEAEEGRESEEGRRLWDDFERTRPLTERDVAVDEPEVTLDERKLTPTPAER
jgi:hypothetical protein